jgi:hypothetical protein
MTRHIHIHILLPTRKNVSAWVAAKLEASHRRRTERANARAGLDWFPVAPPIPVEPPHCPLELDTPRVDWFGRPPTDFDG